MSDYDCSHAELYTIFIEYMLLLLYYVCMESLKGEKMLLLVIVCKVRKNRKCIVLRIELRIVQLEKKWLIDCKTKPIITTRTSNYFLSVFIICVRARVVQISQHLHIHHSCIVENIMDFR